MARNTVEPSTTPTRMTTRSKNATTHPGAILQDQRVRRTKEELEEEKESKNAQMAAKKQRKAEKAARKTRGEVYVARLEEYEDAAIANADSEFPRHRLKKSM
jgi:hypothetical protein